MIRDRNFRQPRRRDFDDDSYDPHMREFGGAPRFTPPRFEVPSGPPVRAVVKWFKPERGFGFVELSDGSGDAFLHASVFERNGILRSSLARPSKSGSRPARRDRR